MGRRKRDRTVLARATAPDADGLREPGRFMGENMLRVFETVLGRRPAG